MAEEPTIPRSRRRTVRLRTLMLLILFIAIGLGWMTNWALARRRAATMIENVGGHFYYDYQMKDGELTNNSKPKNLLFLRQYVNQIYIDNINTVDLINLNGGPVATSDLLLLGSLTELRALSLELGPPNSSYLSNVKDFELLERLTIIDDSKILNDDNFMFVSYINNLIVFRMSGSSVSDRGISKLSNLKNIKEIYLENVDITDKSFEYMSNINSINELDVIGARRITGSGLRKLRLLPNLRTLWMADTGLTDSGVLNMIGAFNNLEYLNLDNTNVSDKYIFTLLDSLKNLRYLSIKNTRITANSFDKIKRKYGERIYTLFSTSD